MNTIDLEERKRLIIQEIEHVEDEWILRAIGKLLDLENNFIEAYNRDIDTSMEQYKSGEFITQEELERESKTW